MQLASPPKIDYYVCVFLLSFCSNPFIFIFIFLIFYVIVLIDLMVLPLDFCVTSYLTYVILFHLLVVNYYAICFVFDK